MTALASYAGLLQTPTINHWGKILKLNWLADSNPEHVYE